MPPTVLLAFGETPVATTIARLAQLVGFSARVSRMSSAPGLLHTLLEDAIRRGIDTRVGFEDTLYGPNGERASGNATLVRAAHELGAGR